MSIRYMGLVLATAFAAAVGGPQSDEVALRAMLDSGDLDTDASDTGAQETGGPDTGGADTGGEPTTSDPCEGYVDSDGDGYGAGGLITFDCNVASGYADNNDDCDDGDSAISPGAADDDCDGVDDDCDKSADDESPVYEYFQDLDGDGVGANRSLTACTQPAGYVMLYGDCDDWDSTVFPGQADDTCDGIDSDCSGTVDEDAYWTVCFPDHDEDGFGDLAGGEESCDCLAGQVTAAGDCDDYDDTTFPGATEQCDGADNDCDGALPAGEVDEDGDGNWDCEDLDLDGMSSTDGDCDDQDANTYLLATEQCDGVDNDCDGTLPNDEEDLDGDGYLVCEGDCDDDDDTIYPGAEEVPDGVDANCDSVSNGGKVGCGTAGGCSETRAFSLSGLASLLLIAYHRRRGDRGSERRSTPYQ